MLKKIILSDNNKHYWFKDGCLIDLKNQTLIFSNGEGNIPQGILHIGDEAFSGCQSLTSITILDSVTSIGNSAFSGCESLTSITIPDSVTSIGNYAFSGCKSLTSITIPNSVTNIGPGAFSYCNSLEKIILFENKHYCFKDGCLIDLVNKSLVFSKENNDDIPQDILHIGDNAFNGCKSLTSITIPDSVTSIGGYAFSCCGSLTAITIPNSVTSIGERAFSNCQSLTSITIPDSVASIGDDAFGWCSENLTIYAHKGSYAQEYAESKNINYEDLAKLRAKEEQRKARELMSTRRLEGKCQHCGGDLKGLFSKKCANCGSPKDY